MTSRRRGGSSQPPGANGEPLWLTLRQLVRNQPAWHDVDTILVVENPSVLALAADTLGTACPPLVCTNGQPRAAAMVLLRSLAAGGVRLRHHGDFDWAGLTIGNLLHRRLPIEHLGVRPRGVPAGRRRAPAHRAVDRLADLGELGPTARGGDARSGPQHRGGARGHGAARAGGRAGSSLARPPQPRSHNLTFAYS